jgi:hypothetical protein
MVPFTFSATCRGPYLWRVASSYYNNSACVRFHRSFIAHLLTSSRHCDALHIIYNSRNRTAYETRQSDGLAKGHKMLEVGSVGQLDCNLRSNNDIAEY